MSIPIVTFRGEKPELKPGVLEPKVLEVLLEQLNVLKQMTQSFVLVEAGTKLTQEHTREEK